MLCDETRAVRVEMRSVARVVTQKNNKVVEECGSSGCEMTWRRKANPC